MSSRPVFHFVLSLLMAMVVGHQAKAQTISVWIGTGGTEGIFHSKLNVETGKLTKPTIVSDIAGSGFLAMDPQGDKLYSTAKKDGDAGVAAFEIQMREVAAERVAVAKQLKEHADRFGEKHPATQKLKKRLADLKKLGDVSSSLKPLNFVSSGDGGAACVGVDKSGKVLMSAQYGGGSTTSYLINPNGSIGERISVVEHGDGSGVNERRQAKSHPHWVGTSPDNRFLMVPDLGKDCVVVYALDTATGEIKKKSEVPTPPGSGPRHMKFHPNGKIVYVLNELALTISVFEYLAEDASFNSIQLIETLSESLKDKHLNSAAEIRVHPTGKFVYSSNRGHDSISVFSVDEQTGKLTFVEREHVRGSIPRNFNLDPSGKWLLAGGQTSNTLSVFEVDQATGELIYTRQCLNVPSPICILFGHE